MSKHSPKADAPFASDPRAGDPRFSDLRFGAGRGRAAPQIDMTLDGDFRQPPTIPWLNKAIAWAIALALLAGGLALAALAFWLALILIPVMLVLGLLGWGGLRYRLWRMRQAGQSGFTGRF